MAENDGNAPDVMQGLVEAVRERLKAEIRDLDKSKGPTMLIYLLEMAKLECDDIISRTGRHAH